MNRIPTWAERCRARLGVPPPIDDAFRSAVERTIAEVEDACGAEVVLVVRKQSGSYRDVCWVIGAGLAWLGLWLILYLPGQFHPILIPFELAAIFLLGAWVAGRTVLRRWFVSKARLARQVVEACRHSLFVEGVTELPAATGILIYWSRLERRIEAIADSGIRRQLPAEHWNAFVFRLHRAEAHPDPRAEILSALRELGPRLAAALPAPPDHVRLLPNRAREES